MIKVSIKKDYISEVDKIINIVHYIEDDSDIRLFLISKIAFDLYDYDSLIEALKECKNER